MKSHEILVCPGPGSYKVGFLLGFQMLNGANKNPIGRVFFTPGKPIYQAIYMGLNPIYNW